VPRSQAIYNATNRFNITINLQQFGPLSSWLQTIAQLCGPKPFRTITINVRGHVRRDPRYLLPFVVVLRAMGLELPMAKRDFMDNRTKMVKSSVTTCFTPPCSNDVQALRVLDDAYELGRKAWVKDWTEEWLELEFGSWVEEQGRSAHARCSASWRRSLRRRG